MTLQSSGSMTWDDIATEFEMPSTNISTANMYKGAGYVPYNNPANSGDRS